MLEQNTEYEAKWEERITTYSAEMLATALQHAAVLTEEAHRRMGKLEQVLTARLEALDAKRVDCVGGHFELSYPSPRYDHEKLEALCELSALEDVLSEGYTAGKVETVWREPSFNMVKVNAWGRQYGAPVQVAIDAARLPETKGPKVKYVAGKTDKDDKAKKSERRR